MKVLFVHGYGLQGSGSSIYCANLASALLRAGHDVTVLAQRVPGDEAQLSALRALGGRFRPLPEDAVAVAYPRAEFPEAPVVATMREGELRQASATVAAHVVDAIYDKPDLVIANHFLHVAHGATLAATLREVPTVVVSHGTDMEYACAASAVARGMARETLARTTKPVALNETARRRLCELLDAPAERFAVVPVGIDTDVFRSFDEPRAPRVVQVGRLLLDKGPHLTIAAFAHLLHDGLDAELELIGDGPDRTSLQALVQAIDTGDRESARRLLVRMADTTDRSRLLAPVAHSLFGDKGADVLRALEGRFASRVRFAGYLAPAEVAARLRRARVCVLPSMVPECYPLTLIEAMASGCLIQASPLGGTAEILAAYEREAWMMDPERPIFSLVSGIPRALRRWNANLAMDLSDRVRGRHEWRGIAPSLCRNERTPSELPPPMRASVWS